MLSALLRNYKSELHLFMNDLIHSKASPQNPHGDVI